MKRNKDFTAMMALMALGFPYGLKGITRTPGRPYRPEMSRWGKRKRERFEKLLEDGHTFEVAFEAVEFNQGEIKEVP